MAHRAIDQLYGMQLNGKRILVAPLDWGLGHATRCIPLIEDLLAAENEVFLGITSSTKRLLVEAFPLLPLVALPEHNIHYAKGNGQMLSLALQAPKLLFTKLREQKLVQRICQKHGIDVVLSDNRFGCRAEGAHNIFMTHQVHLKADHFENRLRKHFQRTIEGFDELWVPDHEAFPGLAGELSHGPGLDIPTRFIGPLSRFQKQSVEIQPDRIISVISGPEPQRSILEHKVLAQMENLDNKCILVRGTDSPLQYNGPVQVHNYMPSDALAKAISQSKHVVCRSGYSSIMDLDALGKRAILVPTPGQSEQEYLAQLHEDHHTVVQQENLDLHAILDRTVRSEDPTVQ